LKFSPPQGYRQGGNQAWDNCVLCGDRYYPESMLGEYEGKKYCNAHLAAKLANEIDPSQFDLTEDRDKS